MTSLWSDRWQGLQLRVEWRSLAGPESDGGTTLRVSGVEDAREWLRFDCFAVNPHWHLAPCGQDEISPLDAEGDCVADAFARLAGDLPGLLERGGAPPALVAQVADGRDDPAGRLVLRDAERAMRHRPLHLDDLDVSRLLQRRTAKWSTYPDDVLPAWVAEMDFPIAAPIRAEIERFVADGDLGYPLELAETGFPEVFCERMDERFGWQPDPARIEYLSEVVQGLYIALEVYSEPGDGVIVQTPIYPPFLKVVRHTGRRLVDNPLVRADTRLEFDLDALEQRVDSGTRLLLLCNPHNPSGRVLSRAELERLAGLAIEHDLLVVSDEIHADLLYDDRRHIPFAALGPEIAERTVTLTSASKPFNIPGVRSAVAHFGSAELQRRFNAIHSRRVRGGPGLFGIHATIAAWRWGQPWLDEVMAYLEANRDFTEKALRERIPEIRFFRPESTYLAWLDCSGLELEVSPADHFLDRGRVALSPGRNFGEAWADHVRLNFATSRPILAEILDRMAKSLGR
jgi:cystathionine beta-lyase